MKAIFYRMLVQAAKVLGPWFFLLVAKGIATGYFLFSPGRRRISCEFYAALFPNRNRNYYRYCTWKQFLNFTHLYLDRFIQREVRDIAYTIEGRRYIAKAHERKTGGILLMSHMGNWEMAAHLLAKVIPDIELLLYMGIRDKEEIEKIQKQSIRSDGIQIIGVDQGSGSPLDIMEGIRLLQKGGFVSMAGDVVWRSDQRSINATFLGRPVRIPEAPFVLALVSGAPLIIFFAFRSQTGAYRFRALPPIHVTAPARNQRRAAIQNAARQYLYHMESALREHPFEWFHFDRFIEAGE
ncbi:MAG: lysophospholipid acyltransferase family protein [Desulfobacteraceae bacterium]